MKTRLVRFALQMTNVNQRPELLFGVVEILCVKEKNLPPAFRLFPDISQNCLRDLRLGIGLLDDIGWHTSMSQLCIELRVVKTPDCVV